LSSFFSSIKKEGDEDDDIPKLHHQPFVQTRIEPGDWDPNRTDPLYRPKFKSRARVYSTDDFYARPEVGFSGEFEDFASGQLVLCYLNDKKQKEIYQLYVELMTSAYSRFKRTSHEYVMRVLAQRFNITKERAAAVVQLQHNEEQYKKEGRVLLTETAAILEKGMEEWIKEAYRIYGEKQPDDFVEDPVNPYLKYGYKEYEDIYDMEELKKLTDAREEREVRLMIDGHHYKEDVYDKDIAIPLSGEAKKLMKAQQELAQKQPKSEVVKEWPMPHTGKPKRPRYKFICQVVDTRELRKIKSSMKGKKKLKATLSYANNSPANSIVVEEDDEGNSTIRAANLADVKKTAWKPITQNMEKPYRGAMLAWLDKINGNEEAWGNAPVGVNGKTPEEFEREKNAAKAEGVNGKTREEFEREKNAVESSDSSSSDESGDDTSSNSDESSDEGEDEEKERPEPEDEDDEKDK
jgi:hypothetical protein